MTNDSDDTDEKKTPDEGDVLKIDFSSLTEEHRKESRFPYRGPVLIQDPSAPKGHAGAARDISKSGIGITMDKCEYQIGQEITIEFFGPGSPVVRGNFTVVNIEATIEHGKQVFRLGLTIASMPKLAKKNFYDLLDKLTNQHGFGFTDNR